jgi:hypothetical protein
MSQSDFLVNVTICAQWNLKLKIKGVSNKSTKFFFISSAAKAELIKLRLVSVAAMPILMGFIS